MASWDFLDWHRTFNKTQTYLLNRLSGLPCNRDLVEAWRQFYHTHEPIVRMTVRREGLSGRNLEQCVREVWLGVLTEVPKLRRTSTRDFFHSWLNQLIRNKIAFLRLQAAGKDSPELPSASDADTSSSQQRIRQSADDVQLDELVDSSIKRTARTNSQLFYWRVVEERSVSDVAHALGLTSSQVRRRQHRMLDQLLTILIQLDA